MRLSLRIIEEIRKEMDPDYPILYRLGAEDMMPGGLTLDDGVKAAKIIAGKGVSILDVSGGLIGSSPEGLEGQGTSFPKLLPSGRQRASR